MEWVDLEEIPEVNSAGQIDQLNDLRFKMQSGQYNLSRGKSEKILENEMPGMGGEFRKKKLTKNIGAMLGKVESQKLENVAHSR